MSGSIALQCQGGQGACGVGVWHQGGWGVSPRCASTSLTTGAGGGGGGGGREGGNGDWFGSVRADSQSRVAWAAAAMHAGVSTEAKIYRQPFWKRPTAQVLNYTLPGKPGLICFLIFGFWPKDLKT